MATVGRYRWQSGACRVRSRSMELGIYHEFPVLPGRSQAECFAAGFDIVDASEECGLDVMWLAELNRRRRVSMASAIFTARSAAMRRTPRPAIRMHGSIARGRVRRQSWPIWGT